MTTTYVNVSDYPAIKRLLQGKTRKRKARIVIRDTYTVHVADTMWSGGSKSYFSLFGIAGNHIKHLSPGEYEIPAGCCVLETGTFCGKEATPTITLSLEDAAFLGIVK